MSFPRLGLPAVLLLFLAGPLHARLPQQAQEALDKGVIAAKVPDYLLAIRYFEEARRLAPQAPVAYLNLGLAESKIPGRELRAMAWFGAYLAAHPGAPNAAPVKEQIAVLEVRNQSNLSRFLKTVQDAADLVSGVYHAENLLQVTKLWLAYGDMTAALKAANLIQGQHNRDAYYRGTALSRIVAAQAESGDIAGAQKTANLIQISLSRSEALIPIAEAKMKAGDSPGAKSTFAAALKTAELIDTEPEYLPLSLAAVKAGRQAAIAITQAKSGDFACAQQTTDLIRIEPYKSAAQTDIAKAQASNGQRPTGLSPLATPQPLLPGVARSDWLAKLDDDNKGNDCPLNTEPFLDLAGYMKSLPPDDAQKIFNGMFDAARKIVRAQNVIHQMLKQQAKR